MFLESAFAERAYDDIALPIAEGQTISQPYTVAFMTQLLAVRPRDKVLEIGTGSGYQCAILCEMRATVFTVERNEVLFRNAKALLQTLGYEAMFKLGDGTKGWAQCAPFDGIIVTAGSPATPTTLKEQLAIGGRLVIPVGDKDSQTMLRIVRTSEDTYETREYMDFRFVPLIGKEGWAED